MFFRGLLGTLRWIIGLAPVILLGYWGFAFLNGCFLTLLTPSVPIVFSYESPAGPMTLRAESFSVNLNQPAVFAEQMTLRGPKGDLIAGVSSIRVFPALKGVTSALGMTSESCPIEVHLDRPYAKLVRNTKGQIALQEYLPKSEGAPSKRAYLVQVEGGVADLVDRVSGKEWRTRATVSRAQVAGVGRLWSAAGAADIEGLGHAGIQAQGEGPQAMISLEGTNLHLTSLYRHLAEADLQEALKGVVLNEATGRNVALTLLFQPERPFRLEGTATVKVGGLKVSDYVPQGAVTGNLAFRDQTIGGTVSLTSSRARADWKGGLQWSPKLAIRGRLIANATAPDALGPKTRGLLGRNTDFRDARYEGILAYTKEAGATLSGPVLAGDISVSGERFIHVSGAYGYAQSEFLITMSQARWAGGLASGWLRLDRTRNLSGAVRLRDANLAELGQRYGTHDLRGQGSAYASVGGTVQSPLVELTSGGRGEFVHSKESFRGDFTLAANLKGDRLQLHRATWNGPNGKAVAYGDVLPSTGGLALNFDTFGIDLAAADARVSGMAAAKGVVGGTLKDPQATGRVEAYDLAFQDYRSPLAVADFVANRDHFGFSQLRVASGQGLVEGTLGLRWRDQALVGQLQAKSLQPSDFGADSVAGVFDISQLALGGILAKPTLQGIVKADDLVSNGVSARDFGAHVGYADGRMSLSDVSAHVGSGKVSGFGTFDFSKKDGFANLKAEALPLSSLPPKLTSQAQLDGHLDADARIDFRGGKASLTQLKGTAEALSLNRVLLGSGEFELAEEAHVLKGAAEIGSLERYVRAENINYDSEKHLLSFGLVADDLDIQNLYQLARPYLSDLSDDAVRRINELNGRLSLDADIRSDSGGDPDIDLKALEIGGLTYAGTSLGKIDVKGSKRSSLLSLDDLTWLQGDSTMLLKGTADLKGDVNLSGEVSKFNFANIGVFVPQLSSLAGEATVSFLASGKTAAPEVTASIESNRVSLSTGSQETVDFGLEISRLHLAPGAKDALGKQSGLIEASGAFNYRGIGGTLEATAPFAYPFEIPENQPLEAAVTLKEQQLSAFEDLLPGIDIPNSQGSLRGSFKLAGPIKSLRAEGGLSASASKIAFTSGKTGLKDATASLSFIDDTLVLSALASSTGGGSIKGLVQSKFTNLGNLAEAVGAGQTSDLMKSSLSGSLDFLNFRFDEGNKDAGQAAGAIAGQLSIGGTLQSPAIGGSADLLDGILALGGTAGKASALPQFVVNPTFDVDLGMKETKVRSGAAQLALVGRGHLGGSLQRPDLSMDMTLVNGSLRLPGAKMKLLPGGDMFLTYRTDQDGFPDPRLDVSLQGQTALTAARPSGGAQRYDITVDVSGNLLGEDGLTQRATSDPGDLSSDRILAMLGQTQILEAFAGQAPAGSADAQKQVRDALTGFALPVALDPITSRLADQLGLDYLTVEYNPFDLTTVTLARGLNRSFLLQARKQIGEPLQGHKPIGDLQLFYRLPVRRGLLNRVSFSVGTDQDRPWKVAAQYGSKF